MFYLIRTFLHTWLKDNTLDSSSWSNGWIYSKIEFPVSSTCDNPKCTDAVSEMYMIFPSAESTKMKPSRVCRRWDPSSFIISGLRLKEEAVGFCSHPSPKPEISMKTIFVKVHWNRTCSSPALVYNCMPTIWEHLSHSQVTGSQSDDRRLI